MTKNQKSKAKSGLIIKSQIDLLEFVRRAILKKYRTARAASLTARDRRTEEMEHVIAIAYKEALQIIRELKEWERKRK